MSEKIKKGDFVRFRDDATSEGQPISEFFMNTTWKVSSVDGELIVLIAKHLRTEITLHTLKYKLRKAKPEETPS